MHRHQPPSALRLVCMIPGAYGGLSHNLLLLLRKSGMPLKSHVVRWVMLAVPNDHPAVLVMSRLHHSFDISLLSTRPFPPSRPCPNTIGTCLCVCQGSTPFIFLPSSSLLSLMLHSVYVSFVLFGESALPPSLPRVRADAKSKRNLMKAGAAPRACAGVC